MNFKIHATTFVFSLLTVCGSPCFAVEPPSESSIKVLEIEAHDLMHDDDHGSGLGNKLKAWAQKLNVPEFILRQRLLARKGGATGSEHLQNLALLLGTSHLIEMSSGPLGASLAAAMDAPHWLTAGIGVVGGVISIPGLDPLCIGLFALYGHEGFRNGVTRVRLFLTSWKETNDPFVAGYDLMKALQQSGQIPEGTRLILNVIDKDQSVDVLLTLEDQKVAIEAIRIRYDQTEVEYADRHILFDLLPWEFRRMIGQLRLNQFPEELFYVRKSLGNGWYELKKEYLTLRAKELQTILSCQEFIGQISKKEETL
jgi:hypothetical protein